MRAWCQSLRPYFQTMSSTLTDCVWSQNIGRVRVRVRSHSIGRVRATVRVRSHSIGRVRVRVRAKGHSIGRGRVRVRTRSQSIDTHNVTLDAKLWCSTGASMYVGPLPACMHDDDL